MMVRNSMILLMDRLVKIKSLRSKLRSGGVSVGSWLQIPHSSIAEIMGAAGYDWIAVDMEHGSIGVHQLPDLFRALELGGTLPLVRVAEGSAIYCKQALDAGAGGVIVPMISSAEQLEMVRDFCRWPPEGLRGVGFSRANVFGKNFDSYSEEARAPLLVAMIENYEGLKNLDSILSVSGLDAILVGPYDLSASMGITAEFDNADFKKSMQRIRETAAKYSIPAGVHVVAPSPLSLQESLSEGYRFVAYSIDAVFLTNSVSCPSGKSSPN